MQWNMDPLKMIFLLNMGIFYCYVSLPEANQLWVRINCLGFPFPNNERGWLKSMERVPFFLCDVYTGETRTCPETRNKTNPI